VLLTVPLTGEQQASQRSLSTHVPTHEVVGSTPQHACTSIAVLTGTEPGQVCAEAMTLPVGCMHARNNKIDTSSTNPVNMPSQIQAHMLLSCSMTNPRHIFGTPASKHLCNLS